MNKPMITLCLITLFFGGCNSSGSDTAGNQMRPDRPNIVLIMADDMGYSDLACYGNPEVSTPFIDRLAAGGLRLTDYHSNGTVCSPTRAALLTGLYPQEAGIDGVVTAKSHRNTGMSPDKYTMSEFLREAGYRTAIFGKWHLGYQPEFGPPVQGFDTFHGFVSGNVDYQSHIDQEGFADWWNNGKLQPEKGYLTTLITDYALAFLEKNAKEQPFFLYLPHGAPHYPYQAPDDPAVRIPDPTITAADTGSTDGTAKRIAKPGTGGTDKRPDVDLVYRKMIESLDENVGRVVSYLEANGLMENTLIIFLSDNGASGKVGSNRPYRGSKGGVYEGGHRVPAIFHWKGTIQPGVSDQLMLSMDIFPTITSLLDIAPKGRFSGQSMLPLFTGKDEGVSDKGASKEERTVFWRTRSGQKAARKGKWKLVLINGKEALYDLSADEKETKDLKAEFPEIQKELNEALENWESNL